ncbi:MAG TPA: EAL domain-containing protein [Salinarimonas sp.]|nr:EAL domain-containing protein [Salinarimonas sp.]
MRELELRGANKALAEKSALLDSTLENMDQGLLMVDEDGVVQVCNQRAVHLLDLPPEIMASKPAFEAVRRYQWEQGEFADIDQSLAAVMGRHGPMIPGSCYERKRPNGTLLEVRTVPLKDGGVVRTYTDATARKRAEEAMARSEALYRALVEASAVMVWRAAPDGSITEGSVGWEAFTGQNSADALGHGWITVVHPEDRMGVVANWQNHLAHPSPASNEYRVRCVDGEYRWVHARAVPLQNGDGSLQGWIGTIVDIHSRKQAEEALRSQEERYRLAARATTDAIWDWDLQSDQVHWGENAYKLLRYPVEQVSGSGSWSLENIHPDDRERVKESIYTFIAVGRERWSCEYRFRRGDGTYADVYDRGFLLRDERGKAIRMVGAMQDVSARKQSEEGLRAGEERLRLALQAGRMFAWERDLSTGWVERSANARDLIGIGSGPVSQFLENILPDDRNRAGAAARGEPESEKQCSELRYVHPNGTLLWLSARSTLLQEEGKPDRLIGVTFDITERKAAEDELWRMANQDPLTGLANRTLFQKRLAAALEHAEASGTSVSLLLLDLDDFKAVNDTLGHDAGDALLKETARRLSAMVREGDTVARLGGDEFAIILAEPMNLDNAACFAEMLTEELRTIFEHDGRALSTKASIGVAAFPDHHREPDELMKDADIALYKAKAEGRSRAVVYTKAARDIVEQKVRVIAEVRGGLDADQFVPFYQPKVCLSTSRIVGLEALARWQHPTRGILTPGYFHPAFSDSEIAVAMGERMIRHVARDVRSWLDQGLDCGRVAVNFSSAEFADPYLARHVLGVLADAGVPTSHFEVEVTESVFLERGTETASAILKEFSEAGVSVALDDFGTGFASLTHLKRYPVHHIKVDQSFVRDLEADQGDAAIVSAVIGLGRSLGMQVTAEGVETAGQAQRLSAMGCDHAQGYLYAKPMIGSRVPWLLGTWGHAAASEVRQTA